MSEEEQEAVRRWRASAKFRERVPPKYREDGKMMIITVHFPASLLRDIERIVSLGYFSCRAEFVRTGASLLLVSMKEKLKDFAEEWGG